MGADCRSPAGLLCGPLRRALLNAFQEKDTTSGRCHLCHRALHPASVPPCELAACVPCEGPWNPCSCMWWDVTEVGQWEKSLRKWLSPGMDWGPGSCGNDFGQWGLNCVQGSLQAAGSEREGSPFTPNLPSNMQGLKDAHSGMLAR